MNRLVRLCTHWLNMCALMSICCRNSQATINYDKCKFTNNFTFIVEGCMTKNGLPPHYPHKHFSRIAKHIAFASSERKWTLTKFRWTVRMVSLILQQFSLFPYEIKELCKTNTTSRILAYSTLYSAI